MSDKTITVKADGNVDLSADEVGRDKITNREPVPEPVSDTPPESVPDTESVPEPEKVPPVTVSVKGSDVVGLLGLILRGINTVRGWLPWR